MSTISYTYPCPLCRTALTGPFNGCGNCGYSLTIFRHFLAGCVLPQGFQIGYQNLPVSDPNSPLNGGYLILPGKYKSQKLIIRWYNYGLRIRLEIGEPGPNDQPGNIFELDLVEGLSVRSSVPNNPKYRNPWIAARNKLDEHDISMRIMDSDLVRMLALAECVWGVISVGNCECGWPRPLLKAGLVLEVCDGSQYIPALRIDPDGTIRDKNGKVIGG